MKIVVISPTARSLYTAALSWQLARDGHRVTGILVRRILVWRRIRAEWAAGPSRLVVKLVRRGLRLAPAAAQGHAESIYAYCRNHHVPLRLSRLARQLGCSIITCDDFASRQAATWLEACQPDAVFFTGGGMVPKPVLERAGRGVVNCHIGPLPAFRGMDVVEWPLLLNVPCALTCHFMDITLDTGPILLRRPIPVYASDTIARIRLRIEPMMVEAMRDVARQLAADTATPEPQRREDGRQYFAMHPRLMGLAEAAIKHRAHCPRTGLRASP